MDEGTKNREPRMILGTVAWEMASIHLSLKETQEKEKCCRPGRLCGVG